MDKQKNLYISFAAQMQQFSGFDKKRPVAVAVSGGGDSLALTFLLKQWTEEKRFELQAITVDHGLRPESKSEAEHLHKLLQKNNINHTILTWVGDKKKSNIQAEARDARYNLMADFCRDNNVQCLFVAHNKQDQAETVLMRLMRGSGVDGLSGIAEESEINGVRVLRPVLSYSKENLRDFLRQHGHEWIEDPSNENNKYARVNVRKFLENAEDSDLLIDRLVETAQNMRRSRDYIATKMRQDSEGVFSLKPEGYFTLDTKKFINLHEEVAYRLLSSIIKAIGGDYYKPRFEKIKTLYNAIKNNELGGGVTLGGCIIFPDNKNTDIVFARELELIAPEIKIEPGQKILWDKRFICELKQKTKKSYTIASLGQSGLKQLVDNGFDISKVNCNKKIIYTLPAIKILEKIVAVPQINYYNENDLQDAMLVKFVYGENDLFEKLN